MAEKGQKRRWALVGIIRKDGIEVKRVKKPIQANSEADLERAEKALRGKLAEEALKAYDINELKSIRVDVEPEIEARGFE